MLVQRVNEASVCVNGTLIGSIKKGLCVFLGVGKNDTREDMGWLLRKLTQVRIFADDEGKTNLSINEVKGDLLVVSQFTLQASLKKGNRPSFTQAAGPSVAEQLYNEFVQEVTKLIQGKTETGQFGAYMQVSLTNDGPFTLFYDSQNRE